MPIINNYAPPRRLAPPHLASPIQSFKYDIGAEILLLQCSCPYGPLKGLKAILLISEIFRKVWCVEHLTNMCAYMNIYIYIHIYNHVLKQIKDICMFRKTWTRMRCSSKREVWKTLNERLWTTRLLYASNLKQQVIGRLWKGYIRKWKPRKYHIYKTEIWNKTNLAETTKSRHLWKNANMEKERESINWQLK